MGDRYLVTRTPDCVLRHWGRVQMDTTYMGMFWGKTLWLVVSVVCGVGSWALDPQRGCKVILDPGVEWTRPVCDQLAREFHCGLNHIETDLPSSHHIWYTTTSMPTISLKGARGVWNSISQMQALLEACRKLVGDCNRLPEVQYDFEHKAWDLLIYAPYSCIVVFQHISDIPRRISLRQICYNTPMFCIVAIFV